MQTTIHTYKTRGQARTQNMDTDATKQRALTIKHANTHTCALTTGQTNAGRLTTHPTDNHTVTHTHTNKHRRDAPPTPTATMATTTHQHTDKTIHKHNQTNQSTQRHTRPYQTEQHHTEPNQTNQ